MIGRNVFGNLRAPRRSNCSGTLRRWYRFVALQSESTIWNGSGISKAEVRNEKVHHHQGALCFTRQCSVPPAHVLVLIAPCEGTPIGAWTCLTATQHLRVVHRCAALGSPPPNSRSDAPGQPVCYEANHVAFIYLEAALTAQHFTVLRGKNTAVAMLLTFLIKAP